MFELENPRKMLILSSAAAHAIINRQFFFFFLSPKESESAINGPKVLPFTLLLDSKYYFYVLKDQIVGLIKQKEEVEMHVAVVFSVIYGKTKDLFWLWKNIRF